MQTETVRSNLAKVVAVDDELNILKSLKRLFRKVDCEFEFFTDPREALSFLEENKSVDLIISDMRMPSMSGAEFLQESLKFTPGATRVLLTGYSDMESTKKAINNGRIFSFVSKPWNDTEFKRTVERILSVRNNAKKKVNDKKKLETKNQNLVGENTLLHNQLEKKAQATEEALASIEASYIEILNKYNNLKQSVFGIFQISNSHQQLHANQMQDMILDLSKQYNIQIDPNSLEIISQFYLFLEFVTGRGKEYQTNKEFHQKLAESLEIMSNLLEEPPNKTGTSKVFKKLSSLYKNDLYLQEDTEDSILANIIQVVSYYIKNKGENAGSDKVLGKLERLSGTVFDATVTAHLKHTSSPSSPTKEARIEEKSLKMIEPGRVLAEDLRSRHGFLLIAKGYQLTEQTLERLLNSPKLVENEQLVKLYKNSQEE